MSDATIIRIIDLETAGLAPPAGVVEAATVDLKLIRAGEDKHVIERGDMWSSLIHPGMPIPPEASGIHDITDETVKDAPSFDEAIGYMAAHPTVMGGAIDCYAAHNSRFDRQWFNPPNGVWIDTYKVACLMWPDAPNHKLGTLRYYLNLKLADNAGPRHRALADAYTAAALLRRALATATLEEMVEVSKQPAVLPRIQFGKHAGKRFVEIEASYLEWMVKQKDMDEDAVHTAFIELQRRREKGETT